MNSDCTYTEIDEQLVKNQRIKTKLVNFSFKMFNTNRTKNRDIIKVALLEVEINRHKETLKATLIDLNGTNMFL